METGGKLQAGAEATGSGSISAGGVGVSAGGGVSVGTLSFGVSPDVGISDGKLAVGLKLDIGLGIGVSIDINFTIDPNTIKEGFEMIGNAVWGFFGGNRCDDACRSAQFVAENTRQRMEQLLAFDPLAQPQQLVDLYQQPCQCDFPPAMVQRVLDARQMIDLQRQVADLNDRVSRVKSTSDNWHYAEMTIDSLQLAQGYATAVASQLQTLTAKYGREAVTTPTGQIQIVRPAVAAPAAMAGAK